MSIIKTPVVVIIFNRLDRAQALYSVLERVKPTDLYIISDGARNEVEKIKVDQVRRVFSKVSWDCKINYSFAETNLGCDARIISGLDWVFETASRAIILEDDCLPDISFFEYCQELLKKYEDNPKVSYISGTNLADISDIKESYYFSSRSSNWGWATWANRWKAFDRTLNSWHCLRKSGILNETYPKKIAHQITDEISRNFEEPPYPWDFLWWVDSLNQGKLSITPKCNLIMNIGFSSDATHTLSKPFFYKVELHELDFPLIHPVKVKRNNLEEIKWLRLLIEPFMIKVERKMKSLLNILNIERRKHED